MKKLQASEYLTVGKLREALEGLDPDLPIILQGDAEGNSYRLGYSAEDGFYYQEESSWDGQVMAPDEFEEWDVTLDEVIPCFLIWPIN